MGLQLDESRWGEDRRSGLTVDLSVHCLLSRQHHRQLWWIPPPTSHSTSSWLDILQYSPRGLDKEIWESFILDFSPNWHWIIYIFLFRCFRWIEVGSFIGYKETKKNIDPCHPLSSLYCSKDFLHETEYCELWWGRAGVKSWSNCNPGRDMFVTINRMFYV